MQLWLPEMSGGQGVQPSAAERSEAERCARGTIAGLSAARPSQQSAGSGRRRAPVGWMPGQRGWRLGLTKPRSLQCRELRMARPLSLLRAGAGECGDVTSRPCGVRVAPIGR